VSKNSEERSDPKNGDDAEQPLHWTSFRFFQTTIQLLPVKENQRSSY